MDQKAFHFLHNDLVPDHAVLQAIGPLSDHADPIADAKAEVVAAFPVADADGLVLVTNGGQLIRCPVKDIRIARRSTRGVKIFDVAAGDRVVSVSPLRDAGDADEAEESDGDA